MIYLLLIALIIMLIISYIVFERDLLAPPVVLNAVYVLSTLFAIYNIDTWAIQLHSNTFWVIVLGNLSFLITCIIIHSFFQKKKKRKTVDKNIINESDKNFNISHINVHFSKIIFVTIIMIAFAFLYIKIVQNMAHSYGYANDYAQMMANYRSNTSYGDDELPSWLMRYNRLMMSCVYVLIYIFINNMIYNSKNKKNYLLLIPILIYCISSLFGAARTAILCYFIYSMVLVYIILNKKYNFVSKINRKYIIRGVICLTLFFIFFISSKGIVGRTDEMNGLYYISFYAGGSIELLDLYLQNPTYSIKFGEEIFRGFRVILAKFGLCTQSGISHMEFRNSVNGIGVGNVYTSYRKYIHDFGYGSIFIFQIVEAIFFSIWYEKIKNRKLKNGIDVSLLFFAYFNTSLFRHSIQESFFSSYIPEIFITGLFMYIWIYYFNKIKITYDKKQIM